MMTMGMYQKNWWSARGKMQKNAERWKGRENRWKAMGLHGERLARGSRRLKGGDSRHKTAVWIVITGDSMKARDGGGGWVGAGGWGALDGLYFPVIQ